MIFYFTFTPASELKTYTCYSIRLAVRFRLLIAVEFESGMRRGCTLIALL